MGPRAHDPLKFWNSGACSGVSGGGGVGLGHGMKVGEGNQCKYSMASLLSNWGMHGFNLVRGTCANEQLQIGLLPTGMGSFGDQRPAVPIDPAFFDRCMGSPDVPYVIEKASGTPVFNQVGRSSITPSAPAII